MTPSDRATSFSTSRPVAVLMVFVAAVVFGAFSYGRLSVRLMPELSYPTITVRTEYSGAAPEEVEKDVSRPIEESLGVIAGLRRIKSVSRAGVSDVIMEFAWDTDMSDAVQDALEKLDLVILPQEAGKSLVLLFDPSLDPVMELSLSSPLGGDEQQKAAELRRLRRIGELQIKRALEPISGVAAVRVRGGLEEELHVRVDSSKLVRAGLSVTAVIDRLAQENINVAGGTIKEGRADYMVRTLNEYKNIEEIKDTVLTIIDGREVRIRDVAQVVRSHRERDMVTRTNGSESVRIDVFKEAEANMVDLSKRVRLALGEVQKDKKHERRGEREQKGLAQQVADDEGVVLEVVADRSVFIKSSIAEVSRTAVLGGLLAVVVLFLFLSNFKSTLIIGVSIPVSLLVTFAPLNLLGVSLNIMSLGGLALGIGMLVDSSIVVLESIVRRREQGDDVQTAAVRGTAVVRGAVIASTLTTIGVFVPMVFVEGVAGQTFGNLGLAVVISLLISLIVALSLIPMLASRGGVSLDARLDRPGLSWRLASWRMFVTDFRAISRWAMLPLLPYLVLRFVLSTFIEVFAKLLIGAFVLPLGLLVRFVAPYGKKLLKLLLWPPLMATRATLRAAARIYPQVLRWAIDHIGAVLFVMVACLTITYVAASSLDSELLPEVHQGEFTIEVALPVGTPIEQTEAILAPVEAAILAERDQIDKLIVTYGYDATSVQRSDEGEHTARFKVLLGPSDDNAVAEQRVANGIRKHLDDIPDLEARLVRPVLFSFKTPIEVEVYGGDLREMRAQADRVHFEMTSMGELADVETSLRKGAPEVQIVYDRDRMRRFGLNVADVADRVRDEVRGRMATRFNRRDHRVPVVVRLRQEDRGSVADVKNLIVDPEVTQTIRLSSIAEISLGEGPSEVRRVDGRRVAVVRANLAPGASLGGAVKALETRLQNRVNWPKRMSFRIAGQNEEWERSRGSLALALGLSIFLVYVIMAAQFESLVYPLIIMFTIPLAFFGTFVTLHALGINISIVVFLGMIMLAGIVVNNAIVLVDYINVLKKEGANLRDAVMRAGAVRLRPILMTTTTTALGLLPMALGLGDGAEIRTPLAITVISGLVVSTALTLIIIPTMYVLVDRLRDRLVAAFGLRRDTDAEFLPQQGSDE